MSSPNTVVPLRQPDAIDDPLTAILRSGARRLLAQAIEAEAEAFLATMQTQRLPDGRDRVVRHGHGPERLIQTGIGPVEVRRVKLRDRSPAAAGGRICFTSALLALGPALAQPGCPAAHSLPSRRLNGRLPGGARRLAGP
jgi:putative transposase